MRYMYGVVYHFNSIILSGCMFMAMGFSSHRITEMIHSLIPLYWLVENEISLLEYKSIPNTLGSIVPYPMIINQPSFESCGSYIHLNPYISW